MLFTPAGEAVIARVPSSRSRGRDGRSAFVGNSSGIAEYFRSGESGLSLSSSTIRDFTARHSSIGRHNGRALIPTAFAVGLDLVPNGSSQALTVSKHLAS